MFLRLAAGLFFIFVFKTNKHYHYYNKTMLKMSLQYTAQGFEPTTFRHESPPITTRPGLPPILGIFLLMAEGGAGMSV